MILIFTSDDKMYMRLLSVLSKDAKPVDIERAEDIGSAIRVMSRRTVDCFIVVEQRKNGILDGVRLIDTIRNAKIYRFTPVIYISEIPDTFGNVSNTYQLFAYLDRGFDPASSKDIFFNAASYRTIRENNRLNVCVEGIIHLLKTDEIEFVRSDGHKTTICCSNSRKLTTRSFDNLDSVMKILDSHDFVRCSRNSLCNVRYIKWIDRTNLYIGMDSGERLKLGGKYKKELIDKLS